MLNKNVIKLLVGMITHVLIKYDNNRSRNFGDYLPNKNRHRRQTTDRQTETADLLFNIEGFMVGWTLL